MLFTGNVLLTFAWASRRVSTATVVKNWTIVYLGNFIGSLGTVALVVAGGWYKSGGGEVGADDAEQFLPRRFFELEDPLHGPLVEEVGAQDLWQRAELAAAWPMTRNTATA